MVTEKEMHGVPHADHPLIKRKKINPSYRRVLLIEKYAPKLLGNLYSLSLQLQILPSL